MKSMCLNGTKVFFLMLFILTGIGDSRVALAQGPEDNLSAYLQLAASDIQAKKKEIVSGVMNFNAAEGNAFWPVYRKYEFEYGNISDRLQAVIRDYQANRNTLNEAKAEELAQRVFKIDEQKVRMSQKYYREFGKVITKKRATQLFQLLRRIDLLVDLKIAAMLPMIGEDW